jgi:ACS family tartrate transporter-like MFS transporter
MSSPPPIESSPPPSALDRARRKAYLRLIPILFVCYVIAYVDRTNVSIAKLTMTKDLAGFNNEVIGFGAGIFFIGYFLLEIPGTLIVERWSARKWISRIMLTWGVVAALTALVKTPAQFYTARFFLGLAEAGFFPGVIVYLTHWFPSRDRARALSWFLIATPVAQCISPKICNLLLPIGSTQTIDGAVVHFPKLLGLAGWQWIYIAWGIPAVVLGVLVLIFLTDRPRLARWLEPEEREALEAELEREKAARQGGRHMTVLEALGHPKVLLLAAAYFFIVTGNYGVEIFLPSILQRWYDPGYDLLTWVLMIPPLGSLVGQLLVGWSSDRTHERRLHAAVPIYLGAATLACTLLRGHPLWLMIVLFTLAATGLKAYLPAFWSLPSLFLTEAAAAGSIGLINSVGNLGGFIGPFVLGYVETKTGSFVPGIVFLSVSMAISATILVLLGLGRQVPKSGDPAAVDPLAEALPEPV